MSNNKQTAVEWLYIKIKQHCDVDAVPNNILEQAKAMQRNEHAQTWDAALSQYKERGEVFIRAWEDFDDYYNETTKELE